jgi:hypothetical protein
MINFSAFVDELTKIAAVRINLLPKPRGLARLKGWGKVKRPPPDEWFPGKPVATAGPRPKKVKRS